MQVSKRAVIITATVLAAVMIVLAIAVLSLQRTVAEQGFQQCITAQGGYSSTDVDEKIAARAACEGYLP